MNKSMRKKEQVIQGNEAGCWRREGLEPLGGCKGPPWEQLCPEQKDKRNQPCICLQTACWGEAQRHRDLEAEENLTREEVRKEPVWLE